MKKSKTTPLPQQFSSTRRRLLRSTDGAIYVSLPEEWCLRQGLDELVEFDITLFQDVHAYAVMIFELAKRFEDVVEEMRRAIKKSKRMRTRHMRES